MTRFRNAFRIFKPRRDGAFISAAHARAAHALRRGKPPSLSRNDAMAWIRLRVRLNSARSSTRASCRAFTMVELLVVMGMIVLFAGGAALALSGRGGEGAALANAQSLVAGLVGATRAQAALHQTNAR